MIDFTADLIDSRDIAARVEELDEVHLDEEGFTTDSTTWDEADRREYSGLQEILEEIADEHVTLINEDYFTEYVKELFVECNLSNFLEYNPATFGYVAIAAEDLLSRAPFNRIDWDAVAEDERHGYSVLDVDGRIFYYQP